MKALNPGEKVTLPNGRTVTFIEVDITAMDDPCEGCCLQDENCTVLDDYTGPCGSGRLDGLFGIFIECKEP